MGNSVSKPRPPKEGTIIAVVDLVSSAADAFPPLKSAAGGVLWILNTLKVSSTYHGWFSNCLRSTGSMIRVTTTIRRIGESGRLSSTIYCYKWALSSPALSVILRRWISLLHWRNSMSKSIPNEQYPHISLQLRRYQELG